MTRVSFERPGAAPFEADLGRVIAEGGGGVVQEAAWAEDASKKFIVKRARAGREALLDYERRTCEQLEHPSIIRYLGVATPEGLGPLLAFEALDQLSKHWGEDRYAHEATDPDLSSLAMSIVTLVTVKSRSFKNG